MHSQPFLRGPGVFNSTNPRLHSAQIISLKEPAQKVPSYSHETALKSNSNDLCGHGLPENLPLTVNRGFPAFQSDTSLSNKKRQV